MYKTTYKVQSSQIGPDKKLKIFDLVNILQDIEGVHIDGLTEFSSSLKENNLGIFLSFRQVNIKKIPVLFDELIVETYPYDTNGYFGYRNTIIYDKDKNVIIETNVLGTFTSLETLRPTKISQEIIDTLDEEKRYPMEYLPRKIAYNEENIVKKSQPIYIGKSYIDSYLHMNNAFYVALAHDSLPDLYEFSQFRAEYKKPIFHKETIHTYLYKELDHYVVVIKNQTDEVSAIIEFK